MSSKWPDFLFTLGVRFLCGAVLGALVGLLLCAPLGHRSGRQPIILWVFGDEAHPRRPYYWFGVWSLIGGIIAACSIPKWQTPWYKRESLNLESGWGLPRRDEIGEDSHVAFEEEKSITIETVGEDGERREYHSMEELPADLRSKLEALKAEVMDAKANEFTVTDSQPAEDGFTVKSVLRKNVSVYKVIDDSGVERTYHSLDEMPPEIRAAISQAGEKFQ